MASGAIGIIICLGQWWVGPSTLVHLFNLLGLFFQLAQLLLVYSKTVSCNSCKKPQLTRLLYPVGRSTKIGLFGISTLARVLGQPTTYYYLWWHIYMLTSQRCMHEAMHAIHYLWREWGASWISNSPPPYRQWREGNTSLHILGFCLHLDEYINS